jgi:hypothetical protein
MNTAKSKLPIPVVLISIVSLLLAAPALAQGDAPDEPGISPLALPSAPPTPPAQALPPPAAPSPPAAPLPPPAPAPLSIHDAEHSQVAGQQQPAIVLPTPYLDSGETQLKSPGMALGLSLGITLGSLAASFAMVAGGIGSNGNGSLIGTGFTIGVLGLAFGPSAGHFYAGDTRRGLGMGFARLGAMGGTFGLGFLALMAGFGGSEEAAMAFFVCGIGAGVTTIVLAIMDIATAPGAARRANQRILRRTTGLNLGPLVTQAVAGQRGYGLALGGRF